MKIRYNPIIPINYSFLLCIGIILILSIWLEVYFLSETNLIVAIFVLLIFWVTWFVHDAIQNKIMHITDIMIEESRFIIITLNEKYTFALDDVSIEVIGFGCIKELNIANTFYISSGYINVKDLNYLEQRLNKKKISLNDLSIKFQMLLFITITMIIVIASNILNIGFDSILYSIIGIYLGYQILKKKWWYNVLSTAGSNIDKNYFSNLYDVGHRYEEDKGTDDNDNLSKL